MSEQQFVIGDRDDPQLFWNNQDGWVDLDNAAVFKAADRETLHLPTGGEWVERKLRYYEIIGTSSGGPLTYRGRIVRLAGYGDCFLALTREFGDLKDWLSDDTFHADLLRFTGDAIDFSDDDTDYRIRIADADFADQPRAYMLVVDHAILPKQIDTLSKLLSHLKADDAYEATVGAVQLLEEIQKQGTV